MSIANEPRHVLLITGNQNHCMNRRSQNALLLFTSHPAKEARRKNLYPDLQRGQRMYRLTLSHIIGQALGAQERADFDFVVASEAEDVANLNQVFDGFARPVDYTFVEHRGDQFAAKLKHALDETQALGYQNIAVIGNDCLDLTSDIFAEAFLGLRDKDLTIGPATDGGFYLLGMRNYSPALFDDVEWCAGSVYQQICRNAANLSASVQTLPRRDDIDSGHALRRWIQAALDGTSPLAKILFSILNRLQHQYHIFIRPFLSKRHIERTFWQLPPPVFS